MSGPEHLRPCRESDAPAVIALYERSFGIPLAESRWRWMYRSVPGSDLSHTVGCWVDGQLVGYVASVPQTWMIEGDAVAGARIQDVCVAPHARGRGVFTRLLHQMRQQHDALELGMVIGFPNDRSRPIFEQIGHYERPADVQLWRCGVVTPPRADPAGLRVEVSRRPVFRRDDVACFARNLAAYPVFQARTEAYLNWRYGAESPQDYVVLRALDGTKQVGVAVAKHYRAGGSVDLLELITDDEPEVLGALLAEAPGAVGAPAGAALEFWAHESYTSNARLSLAGCSWAGTTTAMIARSPVRIAHEAWRDAASWYLSMGDSDVY